MAENKERSDCPLQGIDDSGGGGVGRHRNLDAGRLDGAAVFGLDAGAAQSGCAGYPQPPDV